MADPVGLADLGLRGVGKILTHGTIIRERQRDLDALAVALDQAHKTLLTAKSSTDASEAHEEILEPLIRETVPFFETVGTRKRVKSFAGKYVQPGRDSAIARRLIEAFKAAPEQIQVNTQMRQVLSSQTQLQMLPQVLNDMCKQQRTAVSEMTRVVLLCDLFLGKGGWQ